MNDWINQLPAAYARPKYRSHVEREIGDYLRRCEAAKYLRCSVRQLDEMKHHGDLPFHRFGRRIIVFKTADLDALMDKRRIDVKRQ